MSAHELLVLCGARSSEREVSLRSGAAVARALPGSRLVVLDADAVPGWVDARAHVVIPMLHGGWGEGGGLQAELEARGVAFAGSDAAASRLCMDKVATKARLLSLRERSRLLAGVIEAAEIAAFPEGMPTRASMAISAADSVCKGVITTGWCPRRLVSGSRATKAASRLAWPVRCISSAGVPVADEVAFDAGSPPTAETLLARLGPVVFIKPVDQGSSVGLHRAEGLTEVRRVLASLGAGRWMAEPMLPGRELTVGLLDGGALAVVEILAPGGVYDYHSKYAPGGSRHLAPAPLPPEVTSALSAAAESAFRACGCRDFARVDIILAPDGAFHVLEVNTLPGMTETSLLPDCAACRGIAYAELAARMARGARLRAEAQPR